MTQTPAVRMINVEKYYGAFHALKDINLTVAPGEKIVVCGPSGSGKSTMIRTINQLEEHQSGLIEIKRPPDPRRRSRPSTSCARTSGWCSSTSTCFRI